MSDSAVDVKRALHGVATAARAAAAARYFKTGPGEYGEGDVFLGVSVPDQRRVARTFAALPLAQLDRLLTSRVHEHRLTGLLIMVRQFQRAGAVTERERLFALYLKRLPHVNNWDLVDSSAHHVVGAWLDGRSHALLYRLARSRHLWSRRVAIIATFHFIRKGDAADALRLAALLEADEHDLMHKAVGWMLREVGQRVGLATLRSFLAGHAATMPRTALRYAIEKLPPAERRRWLHARAGRYGKSTR